MAMADSPDQETRRFAAVRATSETIGSPAAVASAKRSPKGSLIGLILILVSIIVIAFVLLFNSLVAPNNSSSPVASPSTSESVEQTISESPESPSATEDQPPSSATETPRNRPAQPSLPAGASPANDAAATQTDAGNLNNVYTGSASTSAGFAQAVRDAFVNHYLDTNELSGRVTATSPVTGGNYTMNCEDNGEYVTCTGGNNAVVYIS